jgi:hypothetical protein
MSSRTSFFRPPSLSLINKLSSFIGLVHRHAYLIFRPFHAVTFLLLYQLAKFLRN